MTDLLTQPVRTTHTPLATEQEAREVAEAAREKDWQAPSFVRELFEGNFRLDLVHPFPQPDPADLARAKPFMEKLEQFMRERVDSDKIDREGKIPPEIVKGLGEIGAFRKYQIEIAPGSAFQLSLRFDHRSTFRLLPCLQYILTAPAAQDVF